MSNIIQYNGYRARINYSAEDKILYGKIEGIKALVTFEGESPAEVEEAFRESVDAYLALCEEQGISPEKEFKGCFNVRISPELHKTISCKAENENITLNKYVENALVYYQNADKNRPHTQNIFYMPLVYKNKSDYDKGPWNYSSEIMGHERFKNAILGGLSQ